MTKYEQRALEIANNLEPVKDIDCPRNCINPGLYFGYMLAVRDMQKLVDRAVEQRNNYIRSYNRVTGDTIIEELNKKENI